jgi:hypothetical protein
MNRRVFQHPAIALGGEAAVVIAAYLLYNLLRVFVEGSQGDAFDHAFRLVSLEQALGLFHEETVQRTMERAPWLYAALEWIYLWAYLPIPGARHRRSLGTGRSTGRIAPSCSPPRRSGW